MASHGSPCWTCCTNTRWNVCVRRAKRQYVGLDTLPIMPRWQGRLCSLGRDKARATHNSCRNCQIHARHCNGAQAGRGTRAAAGLLLATVVYVRSGERGRAVDRTHADSGPAGERARCPNGTQGGLPFRPGANPVELWEARACGRGSPRSLTPDPAGGRPQEPEQYIRSAGPGRIPSRKERGGFDLFHRRGEACPSVRE